VDENLTDHQQAEIVRTWLRGNGAFMLGGLVIGLGGLFGWNEWRDYNDTQAEQASALYENIVMAISTNRSTQAEELIADLAEAYGDTPYLDQSRLIMAKSHMDRSEFEVAGTYLAEVLSGSKSAEMRHIARLRLARVHLQQQQLDEALALLGVVHTDTSFAARYHDQRGDIFVALNRFEDARSEFEMALQLEQQPPVIDRAYVQAKLDDLGVAEVPALDALIDETQSDAGNEGQSPVPE
jgi:predicted negative regulator of RcsB-dependent stress response